MVVDRVGSSALSIDHVGSTSVPGLAAKDVIDIQVSVRSLAETDTWPDDIGPFRRRDHTSDHVPPKATAGPDWQKRLWSSDETRAHVHVREAGRANHRHALLLRDHLRGNDDPATAWDRAERTRAAVRRHRAVLRREGPGVRPHPASGGTLVAGRAVTVSLATVESRCAA